jgi:hypothetical protein
VSKPTIYDCAQYSDLWWQLRRGVPTASAFDRILTPKTLKPSSQQEDYIAELIAEKSAFHVPFSTERGMTRAMEDGIDREPEARQWFSMQTDADVQQVGFVLSECGRWGASPDGLIGDDGGLELKCPLAKTQVRYLMEGGLPSEYKAQVHGSLIVTGRAYWMFLSYCPGLPPLLVRVVPDSFTELLRKALDDFNVRLSLASKKIGGM